MKKKDFKKDKIDKLLNFFQKEIYSTDKPIKQKNIIQNLQFKQQQIEKQNQQKKLQQQYLLTIKEEKDKEQDNIDTQENDDQLQPFFQKVKEMYPSEQYSIEKMKGNSMIVYKVRNRQNQDDIKYVKFYYTLQSTSDNQNVQNHEITSYYFQELLNNIFPNGIEVSNEQDIIKHNQKQQITLKFGTAEKVEKVNISNDEIYCTVMPNYGNTIQKDELKFDSHSYMLGTTSTISILSFLTGLSDVRAENLAKSKDGDLILFDSKYGDFSENNIDQKCKDNKILEKPGNKKMLAQFATKENILKIIEYFGKKEINNDDVIHHISGWLRLVKHSISLALPKQNLDNFPSSYEQCRILYLSLQNSRDKNEIIKELKARQRKNYYNDFQGKVREYLEDKNSQKKQDELNKLKAAKGKYIENEMSSFFTPKIEEELTKLSNNNINIVKLKQDINDSKKTIEDKTQMLTKYHTSTTISNTMSIQMVRVMQKNQENKLESNLKDPNENNIEHKQKTEEEIKKEVNKNIEIFKEAGCEISNKKTPGLMQWSMLYSTYTGTNQSSTNEDKIAFLTKKMQETFENNNKQMEHKRKQQDELNKLKRQKRLMEKQFEELDNKLHNDIEQETQKQCDIKIKQVEKINKRQINNLKPLYVKSPRKYIQPTVFPIDSIPQIMKSRNQIPQFHNRIIPSKMQLYQRQYQSNVQQINNKDKNSPLCVRGKKSLLHQKQVNNRKLKI